MQTIALIEKFKINSVRQYDWDTNKGKTEHYLIVGSIDDKYGVIDNEGNVIVPFEYDNITRIGYELLQTSNGGKVGLVHIENDQDEFDILVGMPEAGRFFVSNIIPCEYDYVDSFLKEGVVFLENYHHSGREIRAYFTFTRKLTEDVFCGYHIIDKEEDLVNLYGHGMVYLYDIYTGECLRSRYGEYKEISMLD